MCPSPSADPGRSVSIWLRRIGLSLGGRGSFSPILLGRERRMAAEKAKGSLATLSPRFPATKVFSSFSSYLLYTLPINVRSRATCNTSSTCSSNFSCNQLGKKQACVLLYFRIFFSLGKRCVWCSSPSYFFFQLISGIPDLPAVGASKEEGEEEEDATQPGWKSFSSSPFRPFPKGKHLINEEKGRNNCWFTCCGKKRNNFIDAFLGFRIPLLLSFSRIPSPSFHFLFPPPSLLILLSLASPLTASSHGGGKKERGREEEDLSCPKNDTTIHALDSHTFAERKAWGMLQIQITNTIYCLLDFGIYLFARNLYVRTSVIFCVLRLCKRMKKN